MPRGARSATPGPDPDPYRVSQGRALHRRRRGSGPAPCARGSASGRPEGCGIKPAAGHPLLHHVGRCPDRLCGCRAGADPGARGSLAQPPRIRLGKPDHEPHPARVRGRTAVRPLRRAGKRALRLGRERHLLRRLRARPRNGGRGRRAGAVCATRNVPGQRHLHRVRRALSAAGHPPHHLRRIRARPAPARRARGSRARGRDGDADAAGVGPGQPGLSSALDVTLHARGHSRTDAVVQQPAAHHHVPPRTPSGCAGRWTTST